MISINHGSAPLHVALPQFDGFIVFESGRSDDIFRGVTGATKYDVGVALKFLDDLLGLQIPYVDLVVLAAADDPLAASDGKVGKDAIFFVFVALIRLEAFALGVVPQLKRVVQSSGENVFTVWRKLDKANRRIVVVDQRLQALSTR